MRHAIVCILFMMVACSSREGQREDPPAESQCQKAVGHVANLIAGAAPTPDGERAAIGAIAAASIARCEAEGLTNEQFRCIMGADTPEAFLELRKCPAIAAKQPSWLTLPEFDDDQ